MSLMQAQDITMNFDGLRAVQNFNLDLKEGELVGLIGPNGAGKTTVFNILTGVYIPSQGTVKFNGEDITRHAPWQINRSGIARTFQNIRLFDNMTVLDNIKVAMNYQLKYKMLSAVLRTPKYRQEETAILKESLDMLKLFNLVEKYNFLARNLSYGEQRRLEIARALTTKPKLLLLDEPAAGMNARESEELMHLISWIHKKFNLTILLIEHHMPVVMGICERIKVLDFGQTIAEGTPEEIKNNPSVIEAYLGEEVEE